jgi:hypothetical protein
MKQSVQRLNLENLEFRTLLATCHVARLGDFGAGGDLGGGHSRGDLRYCINKANTDPGPDVIDFTAAGTIQIQSALPTLSSDIDIRGPGSNRLTLSANTDYFGPYFRIFHIGADADVRISGVTMTNGLAGGFDRYGGGAILNAGELTLNGVVVTGNRHIAWPSEGGGIYNLGTMTVNYSSIDNNWAWYPGEDTDAFGGGIYNEGTMLVRHSTIAGNRADAYYNTNKGGGIFNRGSLTISNSTIVGNEAEDNSGGGGIYNSFPGELSIFHSTIAFNSAVGGGGIAGEIQEMRNTIVAYNTADWAGGDDLTSNILNSGHNLIGKSAGGSGYAPTDILDVDPLLGPLQDNGGPTLTMALLSGSPAIDAGNPSPEDPPEWDQRGPGFPRIVNGRVDIGAFELQATGIPAPPNLAALITADFDNGGTEAITWHAFANH